MSSRRPIYSNPTAAHARCAAHPTTHVRAFHSSLPGYGISPLRPLPSLASELGVRAVFVKDESARFGLPAFKVLGSSWGCYRAILAQLGLSPSSTSFDALKAKLHDENHTFTLIAATEGNHGRALAFMAALLGVKSSIYVPRSMDESTRSKIASEGADLVVVDGDYDDAVRQAATAAKTTTGGLLIQDTAFEGYEEIPAWVVEGYSTLMAEVDEQLGAKGLASSVVVTPVGVGSLAHAVARACKSEARDQPVSVVAVEPDSAPSLQSSLRAGQLKSLDTSATIMDGMNCGTVSTTAWPDLRRLVDACVSVSCHEAHCAVQELAAQDVQSGPCGAASLAALRQLTTTNQGLSFLGPDAVVVLLSTEGPRPYQIPLDVSVEDAVGLTQALTRINSSNPSLSVTDGKGENAIAAYLSAWFAHRGLEYHRVETVPGRPSIVGVLRGTGEGEARSLMFNGHLDTVSLSTYEIDPLSGALSTRDGKQVVLGRGSLDMKGGLAAALAAMASTKARGISPRGDVIVAAVSDEEDASQGTRDILAAGWRADAAVVAEPTQATLVTAHKGFVWVEVEMLGVAAHGSDPESGEDAILSAGWFLRALEQYQQKLPVDDVLGAASLHCGLIKGGEEPSSYPASCTVTVEFRTVPVQTDEVILDDMRALLRGVGEENPRFRYAEPRITMSRPAQKLSRDHPLVETVGRCEEAVLGHRSTPSSAPFWCDAAFLSKAGVPAVVLGPRGHGLHAKEEWVEVESLRELQGVFERLVGEVCS